MATRARKSAEEQQVVLSQESGQVYTDPMVIRMWGDYSARYREREGMTPGSRGFIDTYLSGLGKSPVIYNAPRFGVGNYGTMPRERALVPYIADSSYEYFKSSGLPAVSC